MTILLTKLNALHVATEALVNKGAKVVRVEPRILEAPDGTRFAVAILDDPEAHTCYDDCPEDCHAA